jgi:two-component system alkaline phosphatase synthesis response regulator PhoP
VTHILLIEDEPGLILTLTDRLRNEGFSVEVANTGEEGLRKAASASYDLFLLDVMLPGKDGWEVCRTLRDARFRTPVLMLTARGQVEDKVKGFKLGADDYLTKPFEMAELLARIHALLRRSTIAPHSTNDPEGNFPDFQVDFRAAEVYRLGKRVDLSAQEFRLLCYFLQHQGATLSRNELLDQVWGYESIPSTRTVDVHVSWLRQKLEPNPHHPRYILTVHGLGYKFSAGKERPAV